MDNHFGVMPFDCIIDIMWVHAFYTTTGFSFIESRELVEQHRRASIYRMLKFK